MRIRRILRTRKSTERHFSRGALRIHCPLCSNSLPLLLPLLVAYSVSLVALEQRLKGLTPSRKPVTLSLAVVFSESNLMMTAELENGAVLCDHDGGFPRQDTPSQRLFQVSYIVVQARCLVGASSFKLNPRYLAPAPLRVALLPPSYQTVLGPPH